jgi:hypothetical protein
MCTHFSEQRISSVEDLSKFLIQDHSVFLLDFPVSFFFIFYILHPGFFYLSVCTSHGSLTRTSLYLPWFSLYLSSRFSLYLASRIFLYLSHCISNGSLMSDFAVSPLDFPVSLIQDFPIFLMDLLVSLIQDFPVSLSVSSMDLPVFLIPDLAVYLPDFPVSLIQNFPVFLMDLLVSLIQDFPVSLCVSFTDLPVFLIADLAVYPQDFPVSLIQNFPVFLMDLLVSLIQVFPVSECIFHGSPCIFQPRSRCYSQDFPVSLIQNFSVHISNGSDLLVSPIQDFPVSVCVSSMDLPVFLITDLAVYPQDFPVSFTHNFPVFLMDLLASLI